MSDNLTIASSQSHTYASAYAIQVTPSVGIEDGLTPFLSDDGLTTTWPCKASLYDTAEDAYQALLQATLPIEFESDDGAYLRVVRLELNAKVEVVAMAVGKAA
jgi:hypothetical protein